MPREASGYCCHTVLTAARLLMQFEENVGEVCFQQVNTQTITPCTQRDAAKLWSLNVRPSSFPDMFWHSAAAAIARLTCIIASMQCISLGKKLRRCKLSQAQLRVCAQSQAHS